MEQVVLLDERGRAIGVADKATVHTRETPLHLAFSCYVFNASGQFLLTQRAHTKVTWPGVWTNSCCGHPGPGEAIPEAILRRLRDELGLVVRDLTLVLPGFRYRAVMGNGVVENELCPVYRAFTDDTPAPDPAEVDAAEWVDWPAFTADVLFGSREVSPWSALQIPELIALGPNPHEWPAGTADDLPEAAR